VLVKANIPLKRPHRSMPLSCGRIVKSQEGIDMVWERGTDRRLLRTINQAWGFTLNRSRFGKQRSRVGGANGSAIARFI
jgi:hypothetical protein